MGAQGCWRRAGRCHAKDAGSHAGAPAVVGGAQGLEGGGRGDGGGRGRGRGSRARWPRAEGVCGPLGAPGACPARAGLLGGGAVAVPSLPGASGLRLRSLAPGQ